MKLDPATYACPDHQTDLTDLVAEALDGGDTPLAYEPAPLLRRGATRSHHFQVIVTCAGAPGGQPHSLTCAGTYTR